MAKHTFELTDKSERLLNYYMKRSQADADEIINAALKYYMNDRLTSKQVKDALQHTGKDAFSAQDVIRNFGNWMED